MYCLTNFPLFQRLQNCHVLEVEGNVQHGMHGEFMAVSNRHSVLLLLPQSP